MCAPAPTTSLDQPGLPGTFRRFSEALGYLERMTTEGLMPECFNGHFEVDSRGVCHFVSDAPEQSTYIVEKLYRDGVLRSVALRSLVEKLEHAARRNVQREGGQPMVCHRFAIIEARERVYLLVDAKLARQALEVLRTLPEPQLPIELAGARPLHATPQGASASPPA